MKWFTSAPKRWSPVKVLYTVIGRGSITSMVRQPARDDARNSGCLSGCCGSALVRQRRHLIHRQLTDHNVRRQTRTNPANQLLPAPLLVPAFISQTGCHFGALVARMQLVRRGWLSAFIDGVQRRDTSIQSGMTSDSTPTESLDAESPSASSTPEAPDEFTITYRTKRGPYRRHRYSRRDTGEWFRIEKEWNGCKWRLVGREPLPDVGLSIDHTEE